MQALKPVAALEIVLEHPDLASDPMLLCSAARVCTSWRTAVAASGAGTTDVVFSAGPPDMQTDLLLQALASVASWIQPHAHLVRSLKWADFKFFSLSERAVANLLLAQGLQLAAARPRPLRLQSFSSDTLSTQLLAALPDSLTELQLDLGQGLEPQPRSPTAPWHRLHRLRHLDLRVRCNREFAVRPTLSVSFLSQLTQLTKLRLEGELVEVEWQTLQQALPTLQSLRDLHLEVFPKDDGALHWLVMGSLTSITRLHLTLYDGFDGSQTVLPPNIDRMVLEPIDVKEYGIFEDLPDPVVSMKLLSLQHLRCLEVLSCRLSEYEGFSTQLRQLTQLQDLWLQYTNAAAAVDDAGLWGSLLRLSKLTLALNDPDWRMLNAWCGSLFAGLRGATALTHLDMCVQPDDAEQDALHLGSLFGSIGCLTRLQHLSLKCSSGHYFSPETRALLPVDVTFNPCEAEQLSTLQQLTHLELAGCRHAVGDAVAVSLGLSLSELHTLVLHNCELRTDAVLPVLKRMHHLTHVGLSCNPFVDTAGFEAAAASGRCPWLVSYSSSVQPAAASESPGGDEGGQQEDVFDSDDDGSM